MSTVYCRQKNAALPVPYEADIDAGTVMCDGIPRPVRDMDLGIPFTGRVYGTLFNYPDALAEAMPVLAGPPYKGPPQEAVFYFKPANTLAAYGDTIALPPGEECLQIEGSIGVVIKTFASRLTCENALDHVLGYTLVCDASLPGGDFYRHPLKQRCRDGFCPAGPWIVPATALPDPSSLTFQVLIDGREVQTGDLRLLIRSVPVLLAELTAFMSLYPGDVVLTGSSGKAPQVTAGQSVRIRSAQLGVLDNTVVAGGAR